MTEGTHGEILRDRITADFNQWYYTQYRSITQEGVRTNFERSPGKFGKYLQTLLEPELWALLCATYADANATHTWDALQVMGFDHAG